MFGLHISKTDKLISKTFKTYDLAIKNAMAEYNITVAQIFTHGPQTPNKNNVAIEATIPLYAHSCYIAVGVWSNMDKWKFLIKSELEAANSIGALGLVVHLGPAAPEEIARISRAMLQEFKFPIPIILETPAKKPGINHYSYPKPLTQLCNLLPKELPWGICVDTAHLWASGISVSSYSDMTAWLHAAPSDRILLIHLNANLSKNFGTGKDLHIIPFTDEDGIWMKCCGPSLRKSYNGKSIIWSSVSETDRKLLYDSGFAALVQFAKKNNIPCVGEVNRGSKEEVLFYKSVFDSL